MKEQIIDNLDKIIKELEKGNDVQLKARKNGLKIQSVKIKTL